MKRNLLLFPALFISFVLFAQAPHTPQAPQAFKYQAVVRNNTGNIISEQSVSIQIDILKGSSEGTSVYSETHLAETNASGLVSLEIGNGASSDDFTAINWGEDLYFMEIRLDATGGSNYELMGASQLLSVPYALYALKSDDSFSGSYNDLSDQPILFDGTWISLTGKPAFATIATSGSYDDLSNTPSGTNVGDMQYWDGTAWVSVAVGQAGQYLQLSSSKIPTWTGAAYPTIATAPISSITPTTATGGGNITSDGGGEITARGVCWSTTENPTISLSTKTEEGSGAGEFTSSITKLTADMTYYVRSYASNNAGTTYGNQESFTTPSAPQTVSDFDGNAYNTVTIGTQVWMAENLKVTHYPDGTPIANGTGVSYIGYTDKYYFIYQNDPGYKDTYGLLYSWSATTNGVSSSANPSEVQGVCPDGWHVPSDAEKTELITYLGGASVAGGKLKETGTDHWSAPNEGATNESGFSALGTGTFFYQSGHRYEYGLINTVNGIWTSTTNDNHVDQTTAYAINLSAVNAESPLGNSDNKGNGQSVRCVMDQ